MGKRKRTIWAGRDEKSLVMRWDYTGLGITKKGKKKPRYYAG